ncbi:RecQ family ATP-dependent DNA helicase [Aureispira]|nr:RecQ family ATP-dependent DNA helicase [Aureispira sp.]
MTPHEALKKYWGFDNFRSLQLEIIQSVLDRKDTLALLPTGGGKSICFQVPAMCLPGICIVVSPLISLMKDQVQTLTQNGINAYAIYSGMKAATIDRILDNCVHGKIDFLYLSPERLSSNLAIERIKKMNVALIAVDEAHCISQWGYDFRPSYLNIAKIRDVLPQISIVALTATATSPVVKDIQEKLLFGKESSVFQKSFSRDNLSYVVLSEENKQTKMLDVLQKISGSGIVYVQNRKETKDIATVLNRNGISADYYHAGLSGDIREKVQNNWIKDKIRIIVATNAFGMGIDKPDVRVVVHFVLPDSLEAYFQEAGRCGRDGNKAYAVLLFNQSDRLRLEKLFTQAYPSIKKIRRVYQALGSYFQLAVGSGLWQTFDFNLVDFSKTYDLKPLETLFVLKVLMKEEYIELSENLFSPSTLQIIIRKEELYDYLLRNSKMDKLLKVILRSYQGAFSQPVKIREGQLAQFLNIPQKELVSLLFKLHKDGILRYDPQKDAPQLTFLTERLPQEEIKIDQIRYNFLKKRQETRMLKTLQYAETIQCRSQMLLEYFDEKDSDLCGKCDVCLGRHDSYVQSGEYVEIKSKIESLLKIRPMELRALVDNFSPNIKEKVLETVQHLLDNNELTCDENNHLNYSGD